MIGDGPANYDWVRSRTRALERTVSDRRLYFERTERSDSKQVDTQQYEDPANVLYFHRELVVIKEL